MKLAGLQKTSLLDYPEKICCTIFTLGCNLKCPFCHNASLVLNRGQQPSISEQEIFAYLKKRQGILDGVCITGGEPLLQPDIDTFIRKIRELGFLIKLDTNGTFPDKLEYLVKEQIIDYVAMDIKNSKEKYALTAGIPNFEVKNVEKSVAFLKEDRVPYEFRTTVVREFHQEEDMHAIGQWVAGTKNYYLQNFVCSEDVINPDLHEVSKKTMYKFREILTQYSTNVELRGLA